MDGYRSAALCAHEGSEPGCGLRPRLRYDLMHALYLACAAGNHRQLGIETLEVELADHAVMRLLDQEHPRPRLELDLDELEFTCGQPESPRVFLEIGIRVRKENLCRRLFDQGSADGTVEHIA